MSVQNDLQLDLVEDDYLTAKSIFMKLCADQQIDAAGIGFFGSIGYPGISDLDALVIASPSKLIALREAHEYERSINPDYAYIFWHEPLYIIDAIKTKIHLFHTLVGLEFERKSGESILMSCNDENSDLIHIIWFIFLLQVYNSIVLDERNNKRISARLLLLVHKNIEYSNSIFQKHSAIAASSLITSKELRSDFSRLEDTNNLLHEVNSSLKNTLELFDHYCSKKLPDELNSDIFEHLRSRKYHFQKGQKTIVSGTKLVLNSRAFSLVSDYFMGSSKLSSLKLYTRESAIVKGHYKVNSLRYPFIEPIRLPGSKWKYEILKLSNLILGKFA